MDSLLLHLHTRLILFSTSNVVAIRGLLMKKALCLPLSTSLQKFKNIGYGVLMHFIIVFLVI